MLKRNRIILIVGLIIVLFTLLIGLSSWNENPKISQKTVELVIFNENGENFTIVADLARTDEEKKKGLSERETLGENRGMLFVYEENVLLSFWMKDTSLPLSIAFISSEGRIIDIQDMEPFSQKTHKPNTHYKYALEVNQGFFENRNIGENDIIKIPQLSS